MNGGDTSSGFPFWPFLLLVLAFDLYLGVEVHMVLRGTSRIKQQQTIVSNKIEQVQSQMPAARTWLTMLEGIANDLLDLSKTDADIRKLVEKYQIRKNKPLVSPESKDSKDKPSE